MFGYGFFFPFLINSSAILSISQFLISPHTVFTLSVLTEFGEIVFLGILTIGFIYEWKKGALEWE